MILIIPISNENDESLVVRATIRTGSILSLGEYFFELPEILISHDIKINPAGHALRSLG